MYKIPVGIVNLTNVALVRLKVGKKRFEIACYKNKLQNWRSKVETDINEVLQINDIFSNAIAGEKAPHKDLTQAFKNLSKEEIIKFILDKGEIQVSEKERQVSLENQRKEIANKILEKTFNTETGLPFTQDQIIKALTDINFKIKDNAGVKMQAMKAIALLKESDALPIERTMMKLQIKLKNKKIFETNSLIDEVEKLKEVLRAGNPIFEVEKMTDHNDFLVIVTVLPVVYRDLFDKLADVFSVEILSKTINVQLENETRDKKKEITLDELDYNFSHCKVNDYLDKEFKETAKLKECTKCKESQFVNNDELRKHYKSEWHVYNVKLLSSVKK